MIVFPPHRRKPTRRDELRAGNIDVAFGFRRPRCGRHGHRPGAEGGADFNTSYQTEVVFNTVIGPTADPKVRKALRMVYDSRRRPRGVRCGGNGRLMACCLRARLPSGTVFPR